MSLIASTLKARDVEETLDVYFYRPLGYVVARISKFLGITPNAVTIISIFIGVGAGFMFYYRDFVLNLWGILLWVIADVFDSADGQLARMTNHKSKIGRILDGVATNIIFVSLYLNLFARIVNMGYSPWWFLIVLMGAASHSVQSALADYYRNAYLMFVVDPQKSELHRSADLKIEYAALGKETNLVQRLLTKMYLDYTVRQEKLSKNFQVLRNRVDQRFGKAIPDWFREEYRKFNKPLMKYYAILTTNTRMIVMSVCVLIDQPLWYFFAEAIGINIVMVLLTIYQEGLSKRLSDEIDLHGAQA